MRSSVLLWFMVTLVLGGCMSHMNLREGINSFQVQDYRRAFILLKPEAEKGQPDAAYAVGYMYYYGQGVVENRQKAWYWINNAAKVGQPDAILALDILKDSFPPMRPHEKRGLPYKSNK